MRAALDLLEPCTAVRQHCDLSGLGQGEIIPVRPGGVEHGCEVERRMVVRTTPFQGLTLEERALA